MHCYPLEIGEFANFFIVVDWAFKLSDIWEILLWQQKGRQEFY